MGSTGEFLDGRQCTPQAASKKETGIREGAADGAQCFVGLEKEKDGESAWQRKNVLFFVPVQRSFMKKIETAS